MKNKSGAIIKTILGCYLVFLGVRILMQVTRNNPADSSMMTFLSAAFIGIGALYAFFALRQIIDIKEKKLSQEHREKEDEFTLTGNGRTGDVPGRKQDSVADEERSSNRAGDATEEVPVHRQVNLVSVGPEPVVSERELKPERKGEARKANADGRTPDSKTVLNETEPAENKVKNPVNNRAEKKADKKTDSKAEIISDSQSESVAEKKDGSQTESRAEGKTDAVTGRKTANGQKKQGKTTKDGLEDNTKKNADSEAESQTLRVMENMNGAVDSKTVDPVEIRELNVNASEESGTEVTDNETE